MGTLSSHRAGGDSSAPPSITQGGELRAGIGLPGICAGVIGMCGERAARALARPEQVQQTSLP